MSHVALQRVVVRMLYDAAFARAVYDDPRAATHDVGLDDSEISWLVAPDPRAYGVDPLRRTRALTGLLEEYAVSAATLVRTLGRTRARSEFDAFFSSGAFHRCVQAGASLAGEFGTWLLDAEHVRIDVALGAIVRLERAIVRARRARDRARAWTMTSRALEHSCLVLAAGIVVHTTSQRVAERYGLALQELRAHEGGLVEAVLDARRSEITLDALGAPSGVIVDARTDHVRLESTSIELARVLAPCEAPVRFEEFVAHAFGEGATREDCRAIAASFAEDGILLVVAES